MSKVSFKMNPMGTVKGIIEKWRPRKCKTEKDYEQSLFKYLEKELPDIEIVKQFGLGRAKFDIAVGRNVYIELKHNLDSTSKLQRLIGQLSLYQKEKVNHLIVLICGMIDKNLYSQLDKEIRKYNDTIYIFEEDSVVLMRKLN